ncbi:MAG TPA: hypothetical protein VFH78_14355 [Candidatus Thermoplasmatota archaeon]|nr:hypothetical protein [Candidatus Thermoplasmatota archaeon]
MSALRGGIFLLLTVATVGIAAAQSEPDVNESDFDTGAPEADESYLDESGESSDPTLSEGDFDTSAPEPDESYLGEDAAASSGSGPTLSEGDFDTSVPPAEEAYLADDGAGGSGAAEGGRGVPAIGVLAGLAAVALVAALRRR